jgi:hypothetical protein
MSQDSLAIHAYIQICGDKVAGHSREFAEALASKRGEEVLLIAAKAMAMTAIDLFTDPDLMERAKEEFKSC